MGRKNFSVLNGSPHHHALAQNLSALMEICGISISHLADELGLPVMTIRRLVTGETTNPTLSTLRLLSNKFNVPIDILTCELEEGAIKKYQNTCNFSKPNLIPIISWDTANTINSIEDLDLKNWDNWQAISSEDGMLSDASFALPSKPSMFSRYPAGTLFVVDPAVKMSDGDNVLVKLLEQNDLTLRLLTIDPPEYELHSIVSDAKYIKFDEDKHKIIGVVMLILLFNNRLLNIKGHLYD